MTNFVAVRDEDEPVNATVLSPELQALTDWDWLSAKAAERYVAAHEHLL